MVGVGSPVAVSGGDRMLRFPGSIVETVPQIPASGATTWGQEGQGLRSESVLLWPAAYLLGPGPSSAKSLEDWFCTCLFFHSADPLQPTHGFTHPLCQECPSSPGRRAPSPTLLSIFNIPQYSHMTALRRVQDNQWERQALSKRHQCSSRQAYQDRGNGSVQEPDFRGE